jgi:3'(2'), 5'-bisphosphate nucleotidase
MSVELKTLTDALSAHGPDILRWCGAIAKKLRQFDVSLEGKSSGSSNTDALTLADLTVQELAIAALRDRAPELLACRIEAEEENGDLSAFASESEYVITLDPIDGTKYFRDRTGDQWCVILMLRTRDTVHYSLIFVPEDGETGTWVEACGDRILCGPDDTSKPARQVLDSLPTIDVSNWSGSDSIYLIGFQDRDVERAANVTEIGLMGVAPDDMPGSVYPLLATGQFGGSLVHSPNIYDHPASLQIARILGGDAVWVHNGEPVNFDELWMDERADMLRLPGIVATSPNREILSKLCDLAKDWPKQRYID